MSPAQTIPLANLPRPSGVVKQGNLGSTTTAELGLLDVGMCSLVSEDLYDLGAECALNPPFLCRLNSATNSRLKRSILFRRCSYPSSRRSGGEEARVNDESVVGYLVLGDEGHSEGQYNKGLYY